MLIFNKHSYVVVCSKKHWHKKVNKLKGVTIKNPSKQKTNVQIGLLSLTLCTLILPSSHVHCCLFPGASTLELSWLRQHWYVMWRESLINFKLIKQRYDPAAVGRDFLCNLCYLLKYMRVFLFVVERRELLPHSITSEKRCLAWKLETLGRD